MSYRFFFIFLLSLGKTIIQIVLPRLSSHVRFNQNGKTIRLIVLPRNLGKTIPRIVFPILKHLQDNITDCLSHSSLHLLRLYTHLYTYTSLFQVLFEKLAGSLRVFQVLCYKLAGYFHKRIYKSKCCSFFHRFSTRFLEQLNWDFWSVGFVFNYDFFLKMRINLNEQIRQDLNRGVSFHSRKFII